MFFKYFIEMYAAAVIFFFLKLDSIIFMGFLDTIGKFPPSKEAHFTEFSFDQ